MEQIKTLATCDEVEFLRQTNKIRKAVQKWLTVTDIQNIRKRLPEYEQADKEATQEERDKITEANRKLAREQSMRNLNDILDAVLEEHPEETIEVMKLCCFVDPADKTSRHITFYMDAFAEMLGNEDILNFFQSLMNLGRRFGLTL